MTTAVIATQVQLTSRLLVLVHRPTLETGHLRRVGGRRILRVRSRRFRGVRGNNLASSCHSRVSPHSPSSFSRFQSVLLKILSASKMGRTHLKLSIQSIPFGSAFENTKQLNAPLNCSPHGPYAIPPKHGQSQCISPVSSLKAPSCEACCSVSSSVSGSVDFGGGVGRGGLSWRFGFTDSRVGTEVSSEGLLGGGTATGELLLVLRN